MNDTPWVISEEIRNKIRKMFNKERLSCEFLGYKIWYNETKSKFLTDFAVEKEYKTLAHVKQEIVNFYRKKENSVIAVRNSTADLAHIITHKTTNNQTVDMNGSSYSIHGWKFFKPTEQNLITLTKLKEAFAAKEELKAKFHEEERQMVANIELIMQEFKND